MRRASERSDSASTSAMAAAQSASFRLAHEVGEPALVPGAAALQEGAVVQALGHQRVGQPEHDGRVGGGPRPDRLDLRHGGEVIADRRDAHQLDPRRRDAVQPALDRVGAEPARIDLRVLERQAAESDQQPRIGGDARIGGDRSGDRLVGADDVRQQHHAGAEAVVRHLRGEAAEAVQEPVQLRASVVEAPSARPAVRAAEDRLVAVRLPDPRQLVGHQLDGGVPGQRHEALGPAPSTVGAAVAAQPARARHRLANPCLVVDDLRHGLDQGRGIPVLGEGLHADQPAILDDGRVGAPMGRAPPPAAGGRGRCRGHRYPLGAGGVESCAMMR